MIKKRTKEVEEQPELEQAEVPVIEKSAFETGRQKVYQFVGSAQSFDEVETLAEVTKLTDDILDLTFMLDSIAWNISKSESDADDPKAKGRRVLAEAKTLVSKIEDMITDASDDLEDSDSTESESDPADESDTPVEAPAEVMVSESGDAKTFTDKVKDILVGFGLYKMKTKMLKEAPNFKLFKSDDKYYLYGRPTNNIIDREDDILSTGSHEEFMKFLDEEPDKAPELWTWHEVGTARKNRAHWWDFADGFVHLMWELSEEEAKGIERFCEEFEPGMSHGFLPLGVAPGIKILERKGNIITKYRMEEASILPVEFAANPYTTFQVIAA